MIKVFFHAPTSFFQWSTKSMEVLKKYLLKLLMLITLQAGTMKDKSKSGKSRTGLTSLWGGKPKVRVFVTVTDTNVVITFNGHWLGSIHLISPYRILLADLQYVKRYII